MGVCFYDYLKLQALYKSDTYDRLPITVLQYNNILSAVKISSKFDSTIDFRKLK